MRKVLSLILVAAMLVCGMVIAPVSTTAAILDDGNVSADIYYFGGKVIVDDTFGRVGQITHTGEWTWKEGDPSKGTIKLDGIIEEGEWGDPIVVVDSKYAPNNVSATGTRIEAAKNALFETPSSENTYFYLRKAAGTYDGVAPEGLKYTLYMMWDEEYVYVAAYVEDPDGHTTPYSGKDLWDGDCLQFRLDPKGANAVVEEKGLDHYDASRIDVTTYNADGSISAQYTTFPWSGTQRPSAQEVYSAIPNFMFGYTDASLSGGESDGFDASLRYDAETHHVLDTEGNETDETYTIYHGQALFGLTEGEYWEDNPAVATIYPFNYGTNKNPDWKTGYEIAIPWAMISEEEDFLGNIGAGTELGASFALLNAMKGKGTYNSYLEWGSGVCGSRTQNDPQTCGGSNLITLSDTPYTTARCDHEFSAATCLNPETCTKCGYQRGYASGHTFVFSDAKPCTTTEAGCITGTCTVPGCGYTYTTTIEPYGSNRVVRSFTTTDTTIANKGFGPSGYTTQWYDSDDTDTDAQGNSYKSGKLLYNPDGSSKNSFDTRTFGYAVIDCATIGGDYLIYEDGSPVQYEDDPEFGPGDQTGTYFDMDSFAEMAYGIKADIYVPDFYNFHRSDSDYYTAGLYNWFGGKSIYQFMAGLFIFEKTQQAFFAIGDTDLIGQIPEDVELFKNNCLAWKEVTGTSLVDINKWHEMVFLFDNRSQSAFLYWDDQLQVAAQDYHFELIGHDSVCPLFRRMNIPFYEKDLYATTMSYAVENFLDLSGGHTLTVDGEVTEVVKGQTIELNKAFYIEEDLGHRFEKWTGDTYVLDDATQGVTSFTMPDADVVLESHYYIVGDINDDQSITPVDSNLLKKINSGAIAETPRADLDGDGNITPVDAAYMIGMNLGNFVPSK